MAIRIELFGGLRLQLEEGGEVIDRFGTRHAAHILACLAYHVGERRPLTREFVIEQCWPNQTDEDRARNNLAHALGLIRKTLKPYDGVLLTTNSHLSLDAGSVTTDVLDFRRELSEFEDHSLAGQLPTFPDECADHLTRAVEAYTGVLLPEDDQDWVRCARDELSDEHLQAVDLLVDHLMHLKKHFAALRYAHLAYKLNPDEEKTHFALMRLYVALDRPNAALMQFKEMKKILKDHGFPPSLVCRDSYDSILGWLQSGRVMPPPSIYNENLGEFNSSTSEPSVKLSFLAIDAQTANARVEGLITALLPIFAECEGDVLSTEGTHFVVAFTALDRALDCALAIQIKTASFAVDELVETYVKIALHTDARLRKEGLYRGPGVSTVKLIVEGAHYGQILCSLTTMQELARTDVGQNVALTDMGLYRLRDDLPPERIYRIEQPNVLRDFPPLRIKTSRQIRHVSVTTNFVGREVELDRLKSLVLRDGARLITVTGGPGVGKSRLTQELADSLVESFSGAVWFVPLADTMDARQVGGEIAKVIGLPPSALVEEFEQVTDFLEAQKCLLVLDNFEQIVDQGRQLVKTLMERVPTLTCVVTSRRSLGIATEQVFGLEPLSVPTDANTKAKATLHDSVRLFEDRARILHSNFQVTDENAASISELCRRLEGVPLAIELAAHKLHTMTPQEMVAQMDEDRRFDLLVTKTRDIDARHRSYWTAIEWSYRRLPEGVRGLFARLGAFHGGFTSEAANTVTDAGSNTAEIVTNLLEESLLSVVEGSDTSDMGDRYRMSEAISEFARSQLSDEEWNAVRIRHFHYYLGLAEAAKTAIESGRPEDWLSRLEVEHSNIGQALLWARENDPQLGLRMVVALPRFWEIRGHWRFGCRWLTEILARAPQGDPLLRARALSALGNLSKTIGDESEARAAYEEGYALVGEQDGLLLRSFILTGMGTLAQNVGDFEEAFRRLEECLEIKKLIGDPRGIATALANLGYCAYIQGNSESAVSYLQESVEILESLGGISQIRANSLNNLGAISRLNGNLSASREFLDASLKLRLELNDRRTLSYSFEEFAHLAEAEGDFVKATQLVSAAEGLRAELGYRLPLTEALRSNSFIDGLREILGEEEFQTQWLRGLALDQGQAIDLAQLS